MVWQIDNILGLMIHLTLMLWWGMCALCAAISTTSKFGAKDTKPLAICCLIGVVLQILFAILVSPNGHI